MTEKMLSAPATRANEVSTFKHNETISLFSFQLYLSLVSFAVFIIPAIIIATCYIVIVVVIWSKSSLKFKSSPQNYDETTTCLPHNGEFCIVIAY